MRYQVRIKDTMSDKPMNSAKATYAEAKADLEEAKKEVSQWRTPCVDKLYIAEIR